MCTCISLKQDEARRKLDFEDGFQVRGQGFKIDGAKKGSFVNRRGGKFGIFGPIRAKSQN